MTDNCKPRRPLSGYNIFFQLERDRIVNDEPERLFTADDVATKLRIYGSGISKPKRPKKPLGKIGFTQLAKRIAGKWNSLSTDERIVFEERSKIEKEHYRSKLSCWQQTERANRKVIASLISETDASLATLKQHHVSTESGSEIKSKMSSSTYDLCTPLPSVLDSLEDRGCTVGTNSWLQESDMSAGMSRSWMGSPDDIQPRPIDPCCFQYKTISSSNEGINQGTFCPTVSAATFVIQPLAIGYPCGLNTWMPQQISDGRNNNIDIVLPIGQELQQPEYGFVTLQGSCDKEAARAEVNPGNYLQPFNGFNSFSDANRSAATSLCATGQGRCSYKLQKETLIDSHMNVIDPTCGGVYSNLLYAYKNQDLQPHLQRHSVDTCNREDLDCTQCHTIGDAVDTTYLETIYEQSFPRIVSKCSVNQFFEESSEQEQQGPSRQNHAGDSKKCQMLASLPVASELCNLF